MSRGVVVMIHCTRRQYGPAKAKFLATFPTPTAPHLGAWFGGFDVIVKHMPRRWWHGWRKPKVGAYLVQRDLSFRAPSRISITTPTETKETQR